MTGRNKKVLGWILLSPMIALLFGIVATLWSDILRNALANRVAMGICLACVIPTLVGAELVFPDEVEHD